MLRYPAPEKQHEHACSLLIPWLIFNTKPYFLVSQIAANLQPTAAQFQLTNSAHLDFLYDYSHNHPKFLS